MKYNKKDYSVRDNRKMKKLVIFLIGSNLISYKYEK